MAADSRRQQQQLEGIEEPHEHDVVSGRGKFSTFHPGNEHFRDLVDRNKVAYFAAPQTVKPLIAQMIVEEIRNLNPPGRFLKQDPETKLWSDIGDEKSIQKTRQALREGAPELKREIQSSLSPSHPSAQGHSPTFVSMAMDSLRPTTGRYNFSQQHLQNGVPLMTAPHSASLYHHPLGVPIMGPRFFIPSTGSSVPIEHNMDNVASLARPPVGTSLSRRADDFAAIAPKPTPISVAEPLAYVPGQSQSMEHNRSLDPEKVTACEEQARRHSYDSVSLSADGTTFATSETDSLKKTNDGTEKAIKRILTDVSSPLTGTQPAANLDRAQVKAYLERCAKADVTAPGVARCSDESSSAYSELHDVTDAAPFEDVEFFDALEWSSGEEEELATDEMWNAIKDDTMWFDPEEMMREQAELTEEKRIAALIDVFGEQCQIDPVSKKRLKDGRNNGKSITCLLEDMREQLKCMPDSRAKSAHLEAKQKAVSSEFSDSRLELFLRRENMDPQEAAVRFVKYWEERQTIFGPDKFFLPMTLNSGAFQSGDHKALEAGFFQLLPHLDSSGRQIIVITYRNHTKNGYTSEDMIRAIWYIYEVAFRHKNAWKGVVQLISVKRASLSNFDWKVLSVMPRVEQSALPMSICAGHSCFVPMWITKILAPAVLPLFDTESRSRMVLHDVKDDQLVEDLMSFGFSRGVIPEEFGGDCSFNHSVWLAKQEMAGS